MSEFDEEVRLPVKLEFVGEKEVESDIREVGKIIDETFSKMGKNASDKAWEKAMPNVQELKTLQKEIQKVYADSEKIRDNLTEKSSRLTSTIKNLKSAYGAMYAPNAKTDNLDTAYKKLDEQRALVKRLGEDYTKSTQEASKGLDEIWNRYNKIIDRINVIIDEIDLITNKSTESSNAAVKGSDSVNTSLDKTEKELETITPKVEKLTGAYGELMKTAGKSTVGPNEAQIIEEKTRAMEQLQSKYAEAFNDLTENFNNYYKSEAITDVAEPFEKLLAMQKEEEKSLEKSYETQILKARAADGNAEAIAKVSQMEQAETNKQIANLKKQQATIKEGTAQYYYRLRSIKMLGFTMKSISSTLDNFGKKALDNSVKLVKNYLKLTNVFTTFGGAMRNVVGIIRNMNAHLKDMSHTTNSIKASQSGIKSNLSGIKHEQDGINFSLKNAITFILKYGLGIRSIYFMFNKLRRALSDGMVNLATQWEDVNVQMSSVITSLFQMKNAIAAAVQPILTALAPALEHVANIVTDISYKIASFIAALTGSTAYVYKAKRAQQKYVDKSQDAADTTEDQADATDDAAKAMEDETKQSEELRKELSKLDKLNVLTTDKQKEPKDSKVKDKKAKDKKLKDVADSLDDAAQDMFEKVPIDAAMADWAQKLKDLLEKLFKPIKGAWDKEGEFVMDSWKKALGAIWDLIKDIGHDFLEVWLQAKTQKIFEDLFHILGDIGLIVANLVTNFKKAWDFNKNGKVILESIRDIIGIIVHGIREAADYTVEWSKNLDFIPLVTRIRQVLATQIEPAVQKIVNLLVWVYEHIYLEFLKHFIEQTAPKITHMIGNISEAIGNIADNLLKALKRGHIGEQIVTHIENLIDIVADTMVDLTDSTKKWAKELKLYKLVESIKNFLKDCEQPLQQICNLLKDTYNNVILPLAKYIIEKTLPKAFEIAGKIAQAIGNIAENIGKAFKESDRGKKIADSLKTIFERIGKTIEHIVDSTLEWSKNVDFGPLVESIAKFAKQAEEPIDKICTLLEKLYDKVLLPLATYVIEKVLPKAVELAGDILETFGDIAGKINDSVDNSDSFQRIIDSVKRIAEKVGDTIDRIVKKTKEWSENIDFEPAMKSIAGWLESMEKPIGFICDTFGSFYEDVLLPFWSYMMGEDGLPKLLDYLKQLNNDMDWDRLKTKVEEFNKSFEKFLEKGWEALEQVIEDIGNKIKELVDSGKFDKFVDTLIQWMDDADPDEMATGLERIVAAFVGLKLGVDAVSKVILPLTTGIMTFINFAKQNAMLAKVSKLSDEIKNLGTKGEVAAATLGTKNGGLLAELGGISGIAAIVVAAVANMAFAYGGLEGAVERCKDMFDDFRESFKKTVEESKVPTQWDIIAKRAEHLADNIAKLVDAIFGEGTSNALADAAKTAAKGLIPALQLLDRTILEMTCFGKLENMFRTLCQTVDDTITEISGYFSSFLEFLDGFVTRFRGQVLVIKGLISGDEESIQKGFELLHEGAVLETNGVKDAVSTTTESIGKNLESLIYQRFPLLGAAARAGLFDPIKNFFDDTKDTAETDTSAMSDAVDQTFGKDFPAKAKTVQSEFSEPVKQSMDEVQTNVETNAGKISGSIDGTFNTDMPNAATNTAVLFATPIITNFGDVATEAQTDSAAISSAVNQTLNTDLPAAAQDSKSTFFDVIEGFFKNLKHNLIGDPIVYDIRDGIIQGFTDWITTTTTDTNTWFNDIVTTFSNLSTDIGSALSDLPQTVETKFNEVKKGIESKGKEAVKTAEDKFKSIVKSAKEKLTSTALQGSGKQFINGLKSSMQTKFGEVKSDVSKSINSVKQKFRQGLTYNSLKSVGSQLINGLKAGMMSALNSAYSAISSICNKIVAKAKQAFQTHSPSKVFEEIGKNLIYGLDAGIEETADTSEKSFEEIASNDQWLQGIYDSYETFDKKLLNLMSGMTGNIVEMFNKMNVQIEDSIASLSKMAELNELNNKLSKINTATPDIVTGKRMPSNKNFSTNVTVNNDYKGLSDVLKQAFVDAIKETANLQTNDGNIIVNIDGKNIFQAVRDQNTIYKKQHGVSALA